MAEVDMPSDVLESHHLDFEPSCFYTGFNGPFDAGFAGVSSTNSSDPLTLSRPPRGLIGTSGRKQSSRN